MFIFFYICINILSTSLVPLCSPHCIKDTYKLLKGKQRQLGYMGGWNTIQKLLPQKSMFPGHR